MNAGAIFDSKTPNELIGVLAHETAHLAGGHLSRLRERLAAAQTQSIALLLAGVAAAIAASKSGGGGMGLAGAFLESLSDVSGSALAWAIAAFCLGVEVGHLCVVAPLSGILKIGRDLGGEKFRTLTLRYGSILIALGGGS